jgi:hypothetical protein
MNIWTRTKRPAQRPNFLFEEIEERVAKEPVRFGIAAAG